MRLHVSIPHTLIESCAQVPERRAWLERLPALVRQLADRWDLTLADPFQGDDVSCSWVAAALRRDRTPAVLKLGMPHFEGAHEIDGLRFWNGDPTVRLLDADDSVNAMLLEACEPGAPLRERPEPEQDAVLAGLFRRLWRTPPPAYPFRPLSAMLAYWASETSPAPAAHGDEGLRRDGLKMFEQLSASSADAVVLATDLHAGNVLRAQREPWLVIDSKPFVGDPAYDATQHLLNCTDRLRKDRLGTIRRFADLLSVDAERVRSWLFARMAAGPDGQNGESVSLARALARMLS